ncbi:WD40 repeat domain-containing protein [Catellatospora paridis]|uniref:hypothetical protein n=1 Tax=Catellatospora paridis TaxID=1617086 RepID=UPI0012D46715|nr:hypothetical protein [Catellatospora paridis]
MSDPHGTDTVDLVAAMDDGSVYYVTAPAWEGPVRLWFKQSESHQPVEVPYTDSRCTPFSPISISAIGEQAIGLVLDCGDGSAAFDAVMSQGRFERLEARPVVPSANLAVWRPGADVAYFQVLRRCEGLIRLTKGGAVAVLTGKPHGSYSWSEMSLEQSCGGPAVGTALALDSAGDLLAFSEGISSSTRQVEFRDPGVDLVVVASASGSVRYVLDEVRALDGSGYLAGFAFVPGTSQLALSGTVEDHPGIWLIDVPSGNRRRILDGEFGALSLSPEGRFLAAVCRHCDGGLTLLDLRSHGVVS